MDEFSLCHIYHHIEGRGRGVSVKDANVFFYHPTAKVLGKIKILQYCFERFLKLNIVFFYDISTWPDAIF